MRHPNSVEIIRARNAYSAVEQPTFRALFEMLSSIDLSVSLPVLNAERELRHGRDESSVMSFEEFLKLANVAGLSEGSDTSIAHAHEIRDAYDALASTGLALSVCPESIPSLASFYEFSRFFKDETVHDPHIERLFCKIGAVATPNGLMLEPQQLARRCKMVGLDLDETQSILNVFDSDFSGEINVGRFREVIYSGNQSDMTSHCVTCIARVLGVDEEYDLMHGKHLGESHLKESVYFRQHVWAEHADNEGECLIESEGDSEYAVWHQQLAQIHAPTGGVLRDEHVAPPRTRKTSVSPNQTFHRALPPITDFRRARFLSKKCPITQLRRAERRVPRPPVVVQPSKQPFVASDVGQTARVPHHEPQRLRCIPLPDVLDGNVAHSVQLFPSWKDVANTRLKALSKAECSLHTSRLRERRETCDRMYTKLVND